MYSRYNIKYFLTGVIYSLQIGEFVYLKYYRSNIN